MNESEQHNLTFVAQAINLGMRVLSLRLFSGLVLSMIFGLFAWTLSDPSVLRIVASSIFGALALLFVLLEKKGN